MSDAKWLTTAELEAGLEAIRQSPSDAGLVRLIVRRPNSGEREAVAEAELHRELGLVGDNWKRRGSRHTPDGSADPEAQLTLMNARAIALVAHEPERWPLAGDQIYVDLDLSVTNLPPGTRLAIGSAIVEVTAQPHTGCRLFTARFGADATRFVNSPEGKQLRLRGLNAKIVQSGEIRVGDRATKQ